MGIFDGINEAPVFEKGRKLPDGSDSLVVIDKCQLIRSQQKKGSDVFVCEYTVEESNKAEIGGRYSWTQFMNDQNVAFPALKQFVLAIFGCDLQKDQIQYREVEGRTNEILTAAVTRDYLKGQKVRVSVHNKRTQNDRDFLAHNFRKA
jgi:hypothetical protein